MKKKILPWPGDPDPRFTIRIGGKRYPLDLSNVLSKLNEGRAQVMPIDKQNSAASGNSQGLTRKPLGVRGKPL
jgi:hypothetical protein